MKKTFYSTCTHSFSDMVTFTAINSHFVTPPTHLPFEWHIIYYMNGFQDGLCMMMMNIKSASRVQLDSCGA